MKMIYDKSLPQFILGSGNTIWNIYFVMTVT